jgi:hypothetical protein
MTAHTIGDGPQADVGSNQARILVPGSRPSGVGDAADIEQG